MVSQIQQSGNGNIPLATLVSLFGAVPTLQEQQDIQQRGVLSLAATDAADGTFQNQGAPVQFQQGPATIIVSTLIDGGYFSNTTSCNFKFETGHTITGRVPLVFGLHVDVKLLNVLVNQQVIQILSDTSTFALTIIHDP